jgi:spermidine synthase
LRRFIQWKTLLGQCIHTSPSGWQVYQNPWYLWLTHGNSAIQTCLQRKNPERPSLEYLIPLTQFIQAFPGDCCLLGLGGGGLPHALYPALANFRLQAVENCTEIIAIARQFFHVERVKNLEIIERNAEDFLLDTTHTYQHILVDLYDAEDYPATCNNEAFFTHCNALLNPEGFFSVNLIDIYAKREIFQHIKKSFKHATLLIPIPHTKNSLLFACNTSMFPSFLNQLQDRRLVRRVIWDSEWGCVGEWG